VISLSIPHYEFRADLDNPERVLLFELVGGMKVHRPLVSSLIGSFPERTSGVRTNR
jgi:hypothetical protein